MAGPSRYLNVSDLRLAAQRRLPKVAFNYIDGGADAEVTLRENSRAFEDVAFRPRSAVATRSCDLTTTVLGTTLQLPFLLAPVGSSRMFYPRGEEVAARAAGEAGTGYILSTLSGCHVNDVKAATTGPVWYQLYLVGGHDVARAAIARRAIDAGASAIVVSNHGGRQLDGVAATIRVLPEVVAAVQHLAPQVEVLLDGGIRRGGDVVKALCMGARAVLIGRAYAYGLGAAGGPGVSRAIQILRSDIVRTMQLLGVGSVSALDESFVDVPPQWRDRA